MAAMPKPFDYLIKLLLIGDSGVGKTCILCRFADDAFNSTYITTIGIDFKVKTIELDGKRIKLQIWDTAGQERFKTITTAYYRGAMGILLVYDISSEKSFDAIKEWMANIEEHATSGVEKMILGNKCDMDEKRKIAKERGTRLAINYGVKFAETSAKTNVNIDEAFTMLAKDIKRKLDRQIMIGSGPELTESVRLRSESTSKVSKCACSPSEHRTGTAKRSPKAGGFQSN